MDNDQNNAGDLVKTAKDKNSNSIMDFIKRNKVVIAVVVIIIIGIIAFMYYRKKSKKSKATGDNAVGNAGENKTGDNRVNITKSRV